jgi:hypothetical protein
MKNLVVFNTRKELDEFLETKSKESLLGRSAFGLDLLERTVENESSTEDGIRIDEEGYVVAICSP